MILNCEKAVHGQNFQIEDFTIYYTTKKPIVILNTIRDEYNRVITRAWIVDKKDRILQVIERYNTICNKTIGNYGWDFIISGEVRESKEQLFHDIQNNLIKKQKIRSVCDLETIDLSYIEE